MGKNFDHYERHQDDEIYDRIEIVCLPRYKTSDLSGDEWRVSYALRLFRKGTVLTDQSYNRLSDAVAHLPWLLRTHLEEVEGDEQKIWHGRIEADKTTCHQPGCKKPATVVYAMKKHGSKDGFFVEPVSTGDRMLRAFCDLHSLRGNCDRTDADANYVLVKTSSKPKGRSRKRKRA